MLVTTMAKKHFLTVATPATKRYHKQKETLFLIGYFSPFLNNNALTNT